MPGATGWWGSLLRTRNLVTASGILMAATLAAKVTGFVRIQSIADVFGAGWRTDAFLVAFMIPECLYLFFTEGALSSALVPVFAAFGGDPKRSPASDGDAAPLLSALVVLSLALALPAAAAVAWFRHPVAAHLAPGCPTHVQDAAASLLAVVALYIPMGLVGGVLQGYLNARGHFLAPALGPLLFNVATVAAAYTLGRSELGIWALAWAVVLGGALALCAQFVPLGLLGAGRWVRPDFHHPGLALAGRLMGPVLVTVTLVQSQVILERVMASSLQEGSISAINFAQKILNLPAGFLALTVSTALLPTLAEAARGGDSAGFGRAAARCHELLAFVVLPASAWLVVAAGPLVGLAFERGAFTAHDVAATRSVVAVLGPALLPLAGSLLLTRAFLARRDATTPALVKALAIATDLVLLALLLPRLHLLAVPAAAAAMYWVEYLALLAVAARRMPGVTEGLPGEALRLVAALAASVAPAAWLAAMPGDGLWARTLALCASAAALAVLYPAAAWLFGARSPRRILERLATRRRRSTASGAEAPGP